MFTAQPARREFLFGLGATLGTAAFNALLADGGPQKPHHPARARACIFLFMEGGPSHLDTFDPKPALDKLHLKPFTRTDRLASAMAQGKRYYVRSPFRFRRAGSAGLWLAEPFEHLARVADE